MHCNVVGTESKTASAAVNPSSVMAKTTKSLSSNHKTELAMVL
jgi:hypothetical protein